MRSPFCHFWRSYRSVTLSYVKNDDKTTTVDEHEKTNFILLAA